MKKSNADTKSENSGGFSLVETSIALLIMMVMTLGTASLYVYATNYNASSADRAAALAIAQEQVERLRRAGFDDTELLAGTTTGVVTYANHQYTLSTNVCSSAGCGGSATRKVITVQVTPRGSKVWMNIPVIVVSERTTGAIGPYASN